MNLVIDQGNTFCKLAVFENEDIVFNERLANTALPTVMGRLSAFKIDKAIISTVSDSSLLEDLLLTLGIEALVLNKDYKFPIGVDYQSPATLGIDRLVAAVGAWKMSPSTVNLIIDAGTAITYDIASPEYGFEGGNIAPGLDMRFAAMHQFTDRLPLLQRGETTNVFGKDTQEAMRNGAQIGIFAEIEYYIAQATIEHGSISVFLTGGDAHYFDKKIKNGIFVVPNLVLVGLHEILKIN